MPKVIRYVLAGGLGNRMFEAMLAHSLAARLPGLVVTGPPLPEWRLRPAPLDLPARHLKLGGHRVDVAQLGYLLDAGIIEGIESHALGFRMDLLPPPRLAARLFRAALAEGRRFGPKALVISVRAAEILGPRHPAYRPLPLGFYARLIEETGLHPVFVGQLDDDPYSQALRARFQGATFVPSAGPMQDFATLRAATHLCLSTSSFAWLAAWLSEAETIHLPIAGLYHPGLRKEIDLLPVADPRYRFHLFASEPWGGTPAELQAAISGDEAGREIPREAALRLAHPALEGAAPAG
jgi:hypothetical protein